MSGNPNDPYAPPDDSGDEGFNALLTQYKPLLQKLSISSFMGYCSAISFKRVGKSLAVVIGLGFVVIQGLAHHGFVEVDWNKVKKSATDVIDTVSIYHMRYVRYMIYVCYDICLVIVIYMYFNVSCLLTHTMILQNIYISLTMIYDIHTHTTYHIKRIKMEK